MIVHSIIAKPSNRVWARTIFPEHILYYHGEASRDGRRLTREIYYCNDTAIPPLDISRSGLYVPEAWSPSSGEFVISESIRAALQSLSNISMPLVRFMKLSVFIVRKGDSALTDAFEDCHGPSPETVFRMMPADPLLMSPCAYYELLGARYDQAAAYATWKDVHDITVTFTSGHYSTQVECSLCAAMFEVFPLIHLDQLSFMHENVFDALSSHLDWDFYQTHSVQL